MRGGVQFFAAAAFACAVAGVKAGGAAIMITVIGTGFGCLTHVRAFRAAGFDVPVLVGRDPDKTAERAQRFYREDPFRAIVEAIVWQQLSGKAAATIFERFLGLFPDHRFPTPDDVSAVTDAHLRAIGFSRQKIAYLRDLCGRMQARALPLDRLVARIGDFARRQVFLFGCVSRRKKEDCPQEEPCSYDLTRNFPPLRCCHHS